MCVCVWNYASRNARSAKNFGNNNGQLSAFNTVFAHIKYTSNMAACYVSDVDEVTARQNNCTVGVG